MSYIIYTEYVYLYAVHHSLNPHHTEKIILTERHIIVHRYALVSRFVCLKLYKWID